MAAAKKAAAKKVPGRKVAGKKAATNKQGSRNAATKDPKGGLTAAGRAAFAQRDGSHLKPGVTKADGEMTPEEMKRKGSWAVRFYGRETLPPLVKANGEPTRFALSAHAWGETVPHTQAQARKIAAKGRKLLDRYRAARDA